MKTRYKLVMVILLGIGLLACIGMKSESQADKTGHDSLTEQQKLTACSDCHKQATPEVFTEWYASTHGIGNVKCYQCHNGFEDLAVSPDINQSCNSCHADKVGNTEHTEGKATCWECHSPHSFEAE